MWVPTCMALFAVQGKGDDIYDCRLNFSNLSLFLSNPEEFFMSELLRNEYLTAGDVAKYLHISLSKAYELTRQADFPICRLGGVIRIPRDAFLSWVSRNTRNLT